MDHPQSIAHYRITGKLGEGGMGAVYRATDTKLARDVAIKVLPDTYAKDPDRLMRFTREAQMLASLNHPNIATIHGIEECAIIMELVEGPTLAERIAQGPLPLDEALPIARQIAEALETAHEKGIIHRDLKPANIKITADGKAKVLDFGLAKLSDPTEANEDPASAPTIVRGNSPTLAGVIIGTAGYMSPEQARGKRVDKRTDIWAFGVVLYEMLTGKDLFGGGETVTDLLAAVVTREPDWSLLPASTPPAIQRLAERCLRKDLKTRLRDIGEARILLDGPLEEPASAKPPKAPRWPLAATAAALAITLIVAAVGWYRATRPAPPRPLANLDLDIPTETPLARAYLTQNGGNVLALSSDGTRLALALRGADGKVRLHTRLLNQRQIIPLDGTEDARDPFFSPSGDWIGFFANRKLMKIAVNGGAAVTLCDAPMGFGASWGDDGNIIAALTSTSSLVRIPSGGGTPVAVTKLNPDERTHRWPQVLPGSRAVLFTADVARRVGSHYDDATIEVISLQTGARKTIARGGFSGRYVAAATGSSGTGHLVYMHETTLFAVPFDLGNLASTGVPLPVLEDVGSAPSAGGYFAFAQNGTFVYLSGRDSRIGWPISWVDSSGKTQPLHAPRGQYSDMRFSPDGKRLAFSVDNGKGTDIWVKDLERDTTSRLSFLPGINVAPVWTPGGDYIVFRSINPASGMYGVRSDGSGQAQRLADGKTSLTPFSFSPDGKWLAVRQRGNHGSANIFTMPVEVDAGRGALKLGKAELFLGTPFEATGAEFSPDGRWLAYQSNESGTSEVYVRPFPGPGGRWQISTGGSAPRWSRNGRELLFLGPDGRVMAVGYTAKGDSFAAGKPRVWTEARLAARSNDYDLAPDGKRLAGIVNDDADSQKPFPNLTVLLNFSDELRRRAPAVK